jgi:hypothetical protein
MNTLQIASTRVLRSTAALWVVLALLGTLLLAGSIFAALYAQVAVLNALIEA